MSPQGQGPKKGSGYRSPMKAAKKTQKAARKAGQLERKHPGRSAAATSKASAKKAAMKKSPYDPVIGRVKPGRGGSKK